MRFLVTGSAGHLGEGLMRTLRARGSQVVGVDILPSAYTDLVGSIADPAFVESCMHGIDAVLHSATLHKPHVATFARRDFIDTNIGGTLNLLEAATRNGVGAFVFTSTTSLYGDALVPPPGAPAAWITEEAVPVPKNIYGVTKAAAENLCQLFHRNQRLPCVVLRTSRFFPEADDRRQVRESFADANLKANEFLYRRVDLQDAVDAHLLAAERAGDIGFGRYIVSATTPFTPEDLQQLRDDAPSVVARYFPGYETEYARRGWRMFAGIERVYVNAAARQALGWTPAYDFARVLERLRAGEPPRSLLAAEIGTKGYHAQTFEGEPYPVE
ncbi:NAD-dependent epimerase/dehydratase family protein [Pseudoxanthomonas wuyuanensis]